MSAVKVSVKLERSLSFNEDIQRHSLWKCFKTHTHTHTHPSVKLL